MLSRFFIDRPIFATVLSVVITLIGFISRLTLPVAQYPRITPPLTPPPNDDEQVRLAVPVPEPAVGLPRESPAHHDG
jgi:hypothetical protein